MSLSKQLIYWYLQNKRDLPWRKTSNPYHIWISEIILQQTRVDQGLDYYKRFIATFPTINNLAKAKEEAVLKLWQGLGYYSRARNLHFSAQYIVNELDGKFPSSYKELLKLKGVGDYTASAIASICYNEVTAVVDGNVYRVLARYFGIRTSTNSTKGIKEFKQLAQELIDTKDPATFNQAIMEFGAIQCKPKNPNCNNCPLNTSCIALQKKLITILPIKDKKIKIKKRYFNYLVIINSQNKIALQRRKHKDIWKGLYEFPLIETLTAIDIEQLLETEEFHQIIDEDQTIVSLYSNNIKAHKLSHQHIFSKFWIVETKQNILNSILIEDLEKYPVPKLIQNFIEKFDNIKLNPATK
ncbi:MAG TPA: A/G-specific adenine glycosylase [Flavobacteriaceae bacterium]|nr:A/G-specific adenine glycosylase [Flavobacteriaceae bacterium]